MPGDMTWMCDVVTWRLSDHGPNFHWLFSQLKTLFRNLIEILTLIASIQILKTWQANRNVSRIISKVKTIPKTTELKYVWQSGLWAAPLHNMSDVSPLLPTLTKFEIEINIQHWNLWHRYDVLGWLTFIVYSIGITAIARDYKVHISYLGEKHEIRPLIDDSLHLTFWKYFQLLIRFRRHLKVKL